jgi:ABC-type transport system involved in multi-copper enzyme maturation permease subunit
MSRAYRSELAKLMRPSTLVAVLVLGALTALTAALSLALVDDGPPRFADNGFARSLTQFEAADGAVRGFSQGMGLIGLLIFVVFIVSMTTEFSLGTIRTLFLREPRRLVWLGGKLTAMFTVLAVALLFAVGVTIVTATIVGQARGLNMSAWWTGDGVEAAGSAYLNALVASVFFGLAGTTLGLVVRSTPLALGIGLAWAFPLEHILEQAWSGATEVFPGLVFALVAGGGRPDISYDTSLLTALAYAAVFATIGIANLMRRDVTA